MMRTETKGLRSGRKNKASDIKSKASAGGVVAVQSGASIAAKQGIPCCVGVSERVCGSRGLSMQLVTIPPGGKCNPHSHIDSETALYILSGHAETWYGPGLTQRAVSGPGDFLYIAPDVPHCARNLSETEPVIAITARTDANDQERVRLYEGEFATAIFQQKSSVTSEGNH